MDFLLSATVASNASCVTKAPGCGLTTAPARAQPCSSSSRTSEYFRMPKMLRTLYSYRAGRLHPFSASLDTSESSVLGEFGSGIHPPQASQTELPIRAERLEERQLQWVVHECGSDFEDCGQCTPSPLIIKTHDDDGAVVVSPERLVGQKRGRDRQSPTCGSRANRSTIKATKERAQENCKAMQSLFPKAESPTTSDRRTQLLPGALIQSAPFGYSPFAGYAKPSKNPELLNTRG